MAASARASSPPASADVPRRLQEGGPLRLVVGDGECLVQEGDRLGMGAEALARSAAAPRAMRACASRALASGPGEAFVKAAR